MSGIYGCPGCGIGTAAEQCCNVVLNGSGNPADVGTPVGIAGDLYLNNDDGCYYVSDGSAWSKMFPGVVTGGTWNDATNTLDLTLADGSLVPVPLVDDVSVFFHTHTLVDPQGGTFDVVNGVNVNYTSPDGSIGITILPTGEIQLVSNCCNNVNEGTTPPVAPVTATGDVEGDIYLDNTNEITYVYDGTAWLPLPKCCETVTSGAGLPTVAATDNEGDTYFDTTNNTVYTFDGANWVIHPQPSETVTVAGAAPTVAGSENVGDTYFDTLNNVAYTFDGTAWVAYPKCCTKNVIVPPTAFADPTSPTSAEVQTWLLANGFTASDVVYAHVAGNSTDPSDSDYSYFFDGATTQNTNEPGCCPENVVVPATAFADPTAPTANEVQTWLLANGYTADDVVYAHVTGASTDPTDPAYSYFFDGGSTYNTNEPATPADSIDCNAMTTTTATCLHNDTDFVVGCVAGDSVKMPISLLKPTPHTDVIIATEGQTVVPLTNTTDENYLVQVYVEGERQAPGYDYTDIQGTNAASITLTPGANPNDIIHAGEVIVVDYYIKCQ